MTDPLTRLAYQTLQQGKSLMGVAHKEVSTRLMELVAPAGAPKTIPVPAAVLGRLQSSHKTDQNHLQFCNLPKYLC